MNRNRLEDMDNNELLDGVMPVAPLKIICHESCRDLGNLINKHLKDYRKVTNISHRSSLVFQDYEPETFLVDYTCFRFGTGEGKAALNESIRGKDLFIISDVTNHSLTYRLHGYENHMSPDDIYQDTKRLISAIAGKAHRITVVMPFLYESRQHKRHTRESLDCALALEELQHMGVSNVVTFDAHDPRVQNSTPLNGFDNFMPPYQFIKALIHYEKDLIIDKEHLIVISPDEGALDRAVYFAGVLGVDTGMFYKRRDYSIVVNGKNPIVAHEFLGDNIDGKDVIVIDDMISSGGSMIDVAGQLKRKGARRIFVFATFGLFTHGFDRFDKAYKEGIFDRIFTTNLIYQKPELLEREYYVSVGMNRYIAAIIDTLNKGESLQGLIKPEKKIKEAVDQYKSK